MRRHRRYNVEELLTMEDDGNRWLVRNMIPIVGKTIIYGHGGTFKTSILFDLAIGVASGGALLRQFPIEAFGPVFIVSTESSKYTNKDRLLSYIRARESASPELAMRGGRAPVPNRKEIKIHFCHQAYDFDDAIDQEEFLAELEDIKAEEGRYPALILLDPLDSFVGGDENSARETKPFRRFTDGIAEEYETSVVVIHHSTKSTENPTIRGSGAWRGWCDAALFFQKKTVTFDTDTLNYVDVSSDKQRDGQEGPIFSAVPEFDAIRKMTTFSLITEGIDPDFLTRSIVQQKVLQVLEQYGSCTQKEIIDASGYTYRRIKMAMDALWEDGIVANDVFVERSTSASSDRTRPVPAWRRTAKTSIVDQAAALLKAQQSAQDEDEAVYQVDVVGPVPLQPNGNIADIGGVSRNPVPG